MSINRRNFLKQAGAGAAILATAPSILPSNTFAATTPRFPGKSDVSFVGSSSSGTRRKMIADVLEPWKEKVKAGITGKTILIKPNMVYWMPFGMDDPALSLTHVDAIRGLLDFLRSISSDAPIIIGDCTCTNDDPGDITKMFKNAGYDKLTTEFTGVTLKDLNTMTPVDRHIWDAELSESTKATIPVIDAFVNSNYYIISITRPKTHNCMIMTGVNKNILMAAPLKNSANGDKTINPKQQMHGENGYYDGQKPNEIKCLSYNLYQLANIIYPTNSVALAVLDAWEGMEGEGPVGGTSIMQYCAVASNDPLAVDRLSAKLMGFSDTASETINKATPSYTDMRTLVWMSNAGLGNYDLNKINFILGSLTALTPYIKSYKLHTNYTGDPSYATDWTGGAPSNIFDTTSVKDSRFLDPKPFLVPQVRKAHAGDVTINFTLPVSFLIQMDIYNLQGMAIRSLGNTLLPAGSYSVAWNGCDDNGKRVASGNYVLKFRFGKQCISDNIQIGR